MLRPALAFRARLVTLGDKVVRVYPPATAGVTAHEASNGVGDLTIPGRVESLSIGAMYMPGKFVDSKETA